MTSSQIIRVLQMVRSLDIAGAEKFGIELARALPRNIFDVQVCAFFETRTDNEIYWREKLNLEGIPIFSCANIDPSRRLGNYLAGYRKLRRHLNQNRVDLIHSHFSMGTLMGIGLKNNGFTRFMVRTAHGQSRYEWSPRWYSRLWRWFLFQHVYPARLDAETGVSEAVVNELQAPRRLARCARPPMLIPNGISLDFIQAARLTPRITKSTDERIIGSIGRLSTQKGFIYLIRALPAILNQMPNLKLEILGEGELRESLLDEIGRLRVQNNVKILEKQSNVIPFLKRLDMFVLPSLWEGLPTVVLESMACNTPVLATNIPGTRELIRGGVSGWLVEPANPSALASGILRALASPGDLEQVSQAALQQVDKYSFDNIASQFSNLYQSILSANTGERP